jgi:RNA polymerase sigma-70 factor, ECF subfamily
MGQIICIDTDSADSDEVLLQAVGRGDLAAFSRIVERHQTWAWRVAWRFTGNEEDALDIVQEAFLRLLDASGRYRPTAKFRTYFYRIISRLCLDQAKKKHPLLFETAPDTPDPSPDIRDTMMRQENAIAIRAALEALPPNQRLAIVLRYYENLGYEEIASALETTTKAIERLLARGRERLRDVLGCRENFF